MLKLMQELRSLKDTNSFLVRSAVEDKIKDKVAEIDRTFTDVTALLTAAETASNSGNFEEAVRKYTEASDTLDQALGKAQKTDSDEKWLSNESQDVIKKMRAYVAVEKPKVQKLFDEKKKALDELKKGK